MASNSIMECSSSSSQVIWRYDVFVSFRGEDTRNNFTGFLFDALRKNGIDAFKDDKDLNKGESIAPELLQAIKGSHIFVVVFSKNYASSTWCLRELAEILVCVGTPPSRVLPIFYDVDPSAVRKQNGYYEKAFAQHEERFKGDKEKMEEVQRWRDALTQVANVSGWDIRDKPQYAEIEDIVKNIRNILGHKFSSLPNDNLVGIGYRVEVLTELLCLESVDGVRVVGISGMSGIGKTTLGHALYEKISHHFDFRCFIDDVSKIYRDSSTLGVQKQLLCQSLNEKNLEIFNVSAGTCLAWTRLRHAKALIFLDNVDQVGQLEMITGNRDIRECLGGGSRIIIISRNEHILTTYGVDEVYKVRPLNHEDAIQLFCKHAFKRNYIMSDYKELTDDVLSHVRGHPLAIKVFGSSLFGRNVLECRSAFDSLRVSKNVMDGLRISYNELDDKHKEIFLDIACFFNVGSDYYYVKEILDFRGFDAEYGLKVLVERSLITIKDGRIYMDHLLSDLGKYIVREKSSKKPRKWSRLWDYRDLQKVMSDNMAAKNLEAIVVDGLYPNPSETMMADALSKMRHLKLLKLKSMYFSGSHSYLSNELGYLTWDLYPFECLPPSFQPDKLVDLSLRFSKIKHLWEGTKSLHNLRRLDLSHSDYLIETPDFGEAPNLELLILVFCMQLRQIHPSMGHLRKLTKLNLSHCKSLIKLPHFEEASNLEWLDVTRCRALRQIDPSIGRLRKLTYFTLQGCQNLVSLPNSLMDLNSLEYLNLSGCSNLYNNQLLLDEPMDAEQWKKLCISEVTSSIVKSLFKWWPLHLLYSRVRKDSVSCLLPFMPSFPCMYHLDLSFCNLLQIPDAIGNLRCLERLMLNGNNFATVPSLKKLSKLTRLELQYCKQLKYLPELASQIDFLPSQMYKPPQQNHHPMEDAGLIIFNCPELVERECCTTMIVARMIQQIVQVFHYGNYFYRFGPNVGNVIPGSEIPWWFDKQHVGSSINIDTSSVWHDKNWIGIAFCAVFVVRRERGTVLAMGPPKSKFPNRLYIPVFLDVHLVTDESDHLTLIYYSRHSLDAMMSEFEIRDKAVGFHFEAKKYGYRLVYEKDLQQSNLTTMHSGNPSTRKRKFSAIEQNK